MTRTDPRPPADGVEAPSTGPLLATLPGRAYTDPEVLAREQATIFERLWCCVGRADDLDGAGAFLTVTVGRESVVVVRGDDDRLRAFLNVCRHRGARVCTDGAGRVRRNLRCPYHAWTYDLGGGLIQAPDLGIVPDTARSVLGLHPVAVEQWLGYVWVCLADPPPPFSDVVDQVTARLGDGGLIDRYGLDRLVVARTVHYDVAANWKLIIENFMECYHCASIHPELVDVIPEFADGYAAQYHVGHGAAFADEVDGFTVDGSAGPAPLPGIGPEQDRRYYAVTIRPQVLLNLVPDHAIVARLMPVAPDRTSVTCDWLFHPEVVVGDGATALDPSIELFDLVNRQDFAACERTQPAMSSRAYQRGGWLMPSEHHLAGFQAWVVGLAGPA